MDDRRSNGRTRIAQAASLFFGGKPGARSCDVSVTDIANGGAGIYARSLAVLPLTFELSFNSLRRKCRLVWRNGNFFGVTFEDQSTATCNETNSDADEAIPEPTFPALNDPPLLAHFDNAGGLAPYASKVTDQGKSERRADLRFAIGIAIALALPVLIGVGFYISTTAILRAS
jgi:hypothetical protein